MESPISHHAKLTLARICVVPMASYAPLVEMDSPCDQYDSFDMRVGTALAGLLDSDPKKWVEFLATPKDKGGLGVNLPDVYQRQQGAARVLPTKRQRGRRGTASNELLGQQLIGLRLT